MNASRMALVLVAWLNLVGCQLTPTFTTGYRTEVVKLRPEPLPGTLAVREFEEQRPPRLYSTQGRVFLTYIPLLPYVTLPFERLDESIRIQSEEIERHGSGMTLGAKQTVAPSFETYEYCGSIARAIAEDLAATGLFREVVYTGQTSTVGHRYLLTGVLRETPLRSSVTSYGLGMAGVLLWIVPLPMGKTAAGVTLDLALTDTKSGQVLWRRSLQSEISKFFTLYTSSSMVYGRGGAFSFNLIPPPADSRVDHRSLFSWHFEALRRAMQESKADLALALQRG